VTEQRWCVVQTKPREEEVAVAHLRRQSFEVFMPLLRERKGTGAKVVPMFPGYVFVAIDLSTLAWLPIASTRGVKRLMTACFERPALLPLGWVEQMQAQGTLDMFTDSLSFKKGDKVEFIAGPFEGQVGVCQWTSERRVGLLLDMLGREVTVYSEPRMLKLNKDEIR
jgi:transcriptional antiterminator RfaH